MTAGSNCNLPNLRRAAQWCYFRRHVPTIGGETPSQQGKKSKSCPRGREITWTMEVMHTSVAFSAAGRPSDGSSAPRSRRKQRPTSARQIFANVLGTAALSAAVLSRLPVASAGIFPYARELEVSREREREERAIDSERCVLQAAGVGVPPWFPLPPPGKLRECGRGTNPFLTVSSG